MRGMKAHYDSAADREEGEETSHWGVSAWTPRIRSSLRRVTAACALEPNRDSRMRFFAPRLAIQRAALRPRPPYPPAIKSVALGSRLYDGL